MDIGGWLRSLGLEQYEAAFRDNAINETILPSLTAEDLKDLGISMVGHRRMLLEAIALLRAEATAKASRAEALSRAPKPAQDTAERRQVTVMFSDLVGSTALAGRMDPEDLREVISAYQKCVAEVVQRLGGFIAKYMGDGVLVYFGYPQAHEDDAERAVRAGLEMVAAVNAVKTNAPLQSRVGIATGLVVVGDLIGSGEAQERGIVGETPNLAARLQGVAEPNMVIIAESTRRLLGNMFDLEDLGAKDLKGIAEPVRTWAALRPSAVESRFEALHASGLTELVGREEELEILLRRWSKAKSGEGQVVLLSGEAGIGKSRLTAALLERLANEPHTRLRYFCSPQHTDSAFYPIIGQMERAAKFAHGDSTQVKLDKLDALLGATSTSAHDLALLADMLSLPNDGRYTTPEQRRQRTLNVLLMQTEALAGQKPILMIFEDAHWSDPTSLEVLGRIVNRIATLRVLLLVTHRPEFAPPWIGQPHATALTLSRLPKRDIEAMIDRVVGNELLPGNIRRDIVERTDGIPLFVEEMTKAVLEARTVGAAQQTVASIPSPSLAVPASLHASLMARLDRLGSAKEVAQIGAAIGREFSHALLSAVANKPEPELASALDRLMQTGLLFRQGMPPDVTYLFKHALVQDAAYSTLLRDPRRSLHARIAETLASQFPEIAESQPELLARHFTEARVIDKAAQLWGIAGQRSLAHSALVEAAEQLTHALAQIDMLPPTPELRRKQIDLQVALITPLGLIKGPNAPETKAAAERARLLVEQAEARGEPPDDHLILFSALYGVWNAIPFNGDLCRGLAAQFLDLAAKQQATAPRLIGHRMMGHTLFHTGQFVEAKAHFDKGLVLYNPAEHRQLATRFFADSRMVILCWRSLAAWVLGYPAAAISDADQAIGDGRDIGQAGSLMYALLMASFTHTFCGNYKTATALIDEVTALASEKGSLIITAIATLVQAEIFALNDNATVALQSSIRGLDALRSTDQTIFIPIYLAWLARTYAKVGKFDDAWRCIGEATTAIETRKEAWCEADVDRIAGEIALRPPTGDLLKAQAYFERAVAVARQQQAKSWELRAAMSLARLWRDQGKRKEARELLAPVYGWFTEGFDTRDLKEAKAFLEELA